MSRRPSPSSLERSTQPNRASARAGFRAPGVLVLRHGLSVWNAEQRWQGWADIDLAPEGHAQAESAAEDLQQWPRSIPIRIVASDLRRAKQTAEPIRRALQAEPVRIVAGFRERGVGEWSGKTTEEIERAWPGMLAGWRNGYISQLPGGEDENLFRQRITEALRQVCFEAAAENCTVVVVSHGGVIRTLERLHHVEPKPVANLGGRWFFLVGGEVRGGSRVHLARPGIGPEPATAPGTVL